MVVVVDVVAVVDLVLIGSLAALYLHPFCLLPVPLDVVVEEAVGE